MSEKLGGSKVLFQVPDIIQIFMLVVLIIQLYFLRKTFLADHERRKKQATFEYINAAADRYRSRLDEFDRKYGVEKIVDLSELDDDDKFILRSYLSEVERICAGVNAGVFDFDMLVKTMGGSLVERFNRFHQYIKERQKHRASLYTEFEQFVRRFEAERSKNYQNIGAIKRS
jgi:hypothetical protein